MHVIAAKAVAFGEALTDDYKSYIRSVKENAVASPKHWSPNGFGHRFRRLLIRT